MAIYGPQLCENYAKNSNFRTLERWQNNANAFICNILQMKTIKMMHQISVLKISSIDIEKSDIPEYVFDFNPCVVIRTV